MAGAYLGIDLGGTNVKIGCFSTDYTLWGKISAPTEAQEGPAVVLERIRASAERLLEQCRLSWSDVAAVGLGCPGPLDLERGIIRGAPNLPGCENFPIRRLLAERLGKPVVLENDANAACWGEFV